MVTQQQHLAVHISMALYILGELVSGILFQAKNYVSLEVPSSSGSQFLNQLSTSVDYHLVSMAADPNKLNIPVNKLEMHPGDFVCCLVALYPMLRTRMGMYSCYFIYYV